MNCPCRTVDDLMPEGLGRGDITIEDAQGGTV